MFASYSSWRFIQFAPCEAQQAVGQEHVVGVVKGGEGAEDPTVPQRRKNSLFVC